MKIAAEQVDDLVYRIRALRDLVAEKFGLDELFDRLCEAESAVSEAASRLAA